MFSNPFHRESNRDILQRIDKRVKELSEDMRLVLRQLEKVMGELDTLKTEVSETTTVMASAVALLQGLKQKLDDAIASGDPEALKALSAALDTNTNALAQAITDNTPVEPPPPPPPEEQSRRRG